MIRSAPVLAAALLLAAGVSAQRERVAGDASLRADPYTGGDRALMQLGGYVSFGPFAWADGHGTADIRKELPTVPLLFVETAHFKIGSSLPPLKLPKDTKRRSALKKELKQLERILHDKSKLERGAGLLRGKKRPTRARVLDRWLRLHLYAMRLEQHYARFQQQLRVSDADFEPSPLPDGKIGAKGRGPHLGMRGKFLILLLQKESNLQRYSLKVTGKQQPKGGAHAHYFHKTGNIYYGTHTELMDHHLADDHALHCHVIFCASQALVMGYRSYQFAVPAWVSQGLAQWFSHRLDPLERTYRKMKDRLPGETFDPRWNFNVRRLIKNKGPVRPLGDLLRVQHPHQLDFIDLMCSWSRIDFLLTRHPKEFAEFFKVLNDPLQPLPDGPPPHADVLAQQDRALRQAFGKTPAQLDTEWREFVLATYPRR